MKQKKNILLFLIVTLTIGCKQYNKTRNEKKVLEEAYTTDSEMLDTLQKQTFNYFWDGAEPISGMARERLHMDNIYSSHDKDVITTGGTGFGVMAILVGIERKFITRKQGVKRLEKIINYLEKADRFHGVWPHWLTAKTGKVYPFSQKDNGGDLIETSLLLQGLLTVKEYLDSDKKQEKALISKIEKLWQEVDWNWYTNGEQMLYWHWSPNYNWQLNLPIKGYNEGLIAYILAAASPTHSIKKNVYEKGWASNGSITKDTLFYKLNTIVNHYGNEKMPVGPLFWAHYSYLGLDPNGLKDKYADYWKLNTNHTRIHYNYCITNPNNYKNYGKNYWGLTSSYSLKGYASHEPSNDIGVLSPTAAISSIVYTPKESIRFIRSIYKKNDSLIGKYGPYDAFSFEKKWYTPRYLAINQGTIPIMIENYRTGLFWKLFMRNQDIQKGLKKLGFTSPHLKENNA